MIRAPYLLLPHEQGIAQQQILSHAFASSLMHTCLAQGEQGWNLRKALEAIQAEHPDDENGRAATAVEARLKQVLVFLQSTIYGW